MLSGFRCCQLVGCDIIFLILEAVVSFEKKRIEKIEKTEKSKKQRLYKAFWDVFCCFSFLAILLTLLSFFGEKHWILDLTTHGRLQYFTFFMMAFTLFALKWSRGWVFVSLVFLLLNGMSVVPFYWPVGVESLSEATNKGASLKLIQANLWGRAGGVSCQNLIPYIDEMSPDVLTVEEFSPACHQVFIDEGIEKKYPYARHVIPTRISLYSRIPLDASRIQYVYAGNGSSIIAELTIGSQPVTLIMAHATRPMDAVSNESQKQHFYEMSKIIQDENQPVFVVGDLNTTPWSSVYRKFITETGLRDSQQGFGIQPSWPATYHIPPIHLLPPLFGIDHVLVSSEFRVKQRKLGPRIGSDHLPVFVELALKSKP